MELGPDIRQIAREMNAEKQQRHEARELRAVRVLRSLSWTPDELTLYQRVVDGVGERLAAVLQRKPRIMRGRRLIR